MSEYWFCILVCACIVTLAVALTLLLEGFKYLRHKHLQKQRKAEYKRLKRLQRRISLIQEYADFLALAYVYSRKDNNNG